ncbi:MAG: hypothetical protein AABX29_07525 [Nanoarchaeota archaeon]
MAFRKLFRKLAFYTFLVTGSVGTGATTLYLLGNNREPIEQREEFVSNAPYLKSYPPTRQDFSIGEHYSIDLEQTTPTPVQDYSINRGDNLEPVFDQYMPSEKKTGTESDQIRIEDFFKSPQERLIESLEHIK